MLVAALMSRNVSQILMTVIAAVVAVGGPVVTWVIHSRLVDIKVTVNGRVERLEQALGQARELLKAHGIEPPPTPPSPDAPPSTLTAADVARIIDARLVAASAAAPATTA